MQQLTSAHTIKKKRTWPQRNEQAFILLARIGVLVGLIALWQIAYTFSWISPVILPSPLATLEGFIYLHESGTLWPNFLSTMWATLVALVLAGAVGVTIGLLLALLRRVELVVTPFLDAFNSAPRIALAPVFIVIFGLGEASKIALAFTLVVFILIMNTRAGVHSADEDNRKLLTVMGANKRQIFSMVLLPVAVPAITAGMRLGLIWSLLGVVTMELIASRNGLGQLISQYSAVFSMAEVYAVILLLVVVAALLNTGTRFIERKLLVWQPPADR